MSVSTIHQLSLSLIINKQFRHITEKLDVALVIVYNLVLIIMLGLPMHVYLLLCRCIDCCNNNILIFRINSHFG